MIVSTQLPLESGRYRVLNTLKLDPKKEVIAMTGKWKKVEMNPTWNFEEDKEIIGTYVSMEENVGSNNSNLYSLKKADSSLIGIWGSTLLDHRFKNIQIGDEVKIIYLGKETSEKTGREFNNFEVYTRPNDPNGKSKNEDAEDPPF